MLWLATWATPAVVQLILSVMFQQTGIFGTADLLFWVVVIAAGLCVVTSTAVIARAVKRRESELGYTGLFFLAVSVLPLVHGITTPGVLYGDNTATMSAVFWSIPAALLLAAPLLGSRRVRLRHADRLFSRWARVGVGLVFAVAAIMLWFPDAIPLPAPSSAGAVLVALAGFAGCVRLSHRHLHFATVADAVGPLAISMGYGFVGASAFVWLGAAPLSAGFWVAHILDICGVFAGTIGAIIVLRRTSDVRSVISPVLVADPLAALELGLDPTVHRFVADLEAKDPITRDHVVRTAELAIGIAEELGLDASTVRTVGLAALLHDVGKLEIPDEILQKPGSLTNDEYELMKRHVIYGESLVASSPALQEIGPAVRAHHERIDGRGYPDGRVGQSIPLAARIVSVCDAFDAMANTRQYRDGMGTKRALEVLVEHANQQWDEDVVRAALLVVARNPPVERPRALEMVGRHRLPNEPEPRVGCDCLPVTPTGAALSDDTPLSDAA